MDITQAFLQYLKEEKKYSGLTVSEYGRDVKQYEMFLSRHHIDMESAEVKHIRLWISDLTLQGVTPRSIHRKLSSLHCMYHYLQLQGKVSENWAERVMKPKLSKRLPVFFSENEMDNLLERIDYEPTFEGIRDRLLLELLYSTGMRCSELIGIKHSDIDGAACSIRILGKRNKVRMVPLVPLVARLLEEYTEAKERKFGLASGDDTLLLTSKGAPLYRKMVYRTVRKYIDRVSVLSKRSPHIIRHTFATHMLNHGADINAIKSILGHSSLASTQVYTHTSISQLKQTYNQAHPRA
ncbi:MAG: tyrosine-type recombinase/integrase [Bacteroidales bacterium]|nr:tyrosine-type recombinase/integrase [Bacteroidales bacterium]